MDGKKILVVGYYGDGNTGDEAILTSMLRDLRRSRQELSFTVPAYGPNAAGLEAAHGVESFHFQDMTRMLDAVEGANLVIVGGGGLLHDLWPPEPEKMLTAEHWGLTYHCGVPWLAAELGKPVMLYAVGAGPLLFPEGRDLVRDLARASRVITVRDEASARLLADLASDIPPPELTADPVWRLNPLEGDALSEFLRRAGIPPGPWLGVSVRNWNVDVDQAAWEEALVAGLDSFARARGLGVLFLPFQYATTPLQDDVGLSRRVAARLATRAHVLDRVSTPEEIGGAIGSCELLLGMRLHSVLLACMTGTPAAALDYDPKVALHTALLDPPLPSVRLTDLTAGNLVETLERAWDSRSEISGRQKALAERLRGRAARNSEAALELLDRPLAAPRPEALRTAAAARRIEASRSAGVAVGARPERERRAGARNRPGAVRIVVSTFFDPDGGDMAFGGAERYLIELASLIRGLGYAVDVFQRAGSKPWVRYYRETRIAGVVPESDPFLLDGAIRQASPGEPALTIYLAFYLGAEAPPDSIGISHCVYWDDPFYQSDPALLKAHVDRALVSIEKLGTLVSVDTNTINWVRATRGALAEKCAYIPNFVDLEEFHPVPRAAGEDIVALFPCRLQPPKGFWLLAEIVPDLLERHPRLQFHFVGKAGAREREAVRALVEQHPGRVRWDFLPPERMKEAYASADLVLLPTVAAEGTSLSCLEAQACGKAVVATHVGGLADLIVSGHNGLLIEPNASALSGAIERLILDPDLRERLGRNASATAWEFRIEQWRARWSALLRTHLVPRSEAAVERARREPVTALFPAAIASTEGPVPENLWPLAVELAHHGVDTYWVDRDGTRKSPHPRLHVLSPDEDLYLLRPLVFVAEKEQSWKTARPMLRARLKQRREEAVSQSKIQNPKSKIPPPSPLPPLDRPSEEAFDRARQAELEGALARVRRDSVEERSQRRLELALSEERRLLLQRELAGAQAYVAGILAEREATVSALNLRLAQGDREKAELEKSLKADIGSLDARLAALRRESEAALSAMKETIASANRERDDLKLERDGLNRERDDLRKTLDQSRARVSALERQLASKGRDAETVERERDRLSADLAAAAQERETVGRELRSAREESLQRHSHLTFAMEEIERLRNTPWSRLTRAVERGARVVRRPREALYKHTAPGSRLYELGLQLMPRPLARWTRRAFAPHPPGEAPAPPPELPPEFVSAAEALPPAPAGRYDVIVLSIIDWDFRFQRPQQLATQFGRNGHRVFYLSTTDFLVADRKDYSLVPKGDGVAELRIRNRRALDIYGGALETEDLKALEQSFESLARQFSIGDAVCLVELPFWWPLAKRLRERFGWRILYDCMDEWTNFPGFSERVLALEEDLVRSADVTIVSADRLLEKWEARARTLVLARNGVDLRHYRSLYAENTLLGDVARPVIGYYGALASWVDVALIEKVARHRPDATIVLAGGHFDVDLSPLAALSNVRLLGQRPYEEMPRLLWNFDICMIPFLVNDITEATNPVKFYEYLYGEKPVVAPDLSELLPFAGVSYLARGHEEFLRQIDRALAEPADDPRRGERRAIAEGNDWSVRYGTLDDAARLTYPLVSVVVVTYGGLALTKACLDSLLHAETWPSLDIIVVDNASADGTVPYLRGVSENDPRVRCVFNSENRGFAGANNQGIAQALGRTIVLLNNDTVVPPGLLGRLAAHLERDSTIGLLCPTTNFCGNEARIEAGYADISGLPAFAAGRARDFEGQTFDIAVAAMYCVAARADVLETIGPLDEAFGVGLFEDDDFSLRTRAAGYRVVCAQDAYVHHVGQGSFRLLSPEQYAAIWKRNQAYFENKWGKAWEPHKPRAGVRGPASRLRTIP